jgi:hypothetical protein
MSTEDLLRDTLHAKADEAAARLTVDDVRRGVLEQRRHAHRRMVLVAAAAVLAAVAVPSALLLRPDDVTPSPAPSPATPSPSAPRPTPSSSATSATTGGLADIPGGRPPGISYLQDGTVHLAGGGSTQLPDPSAPVTAFTGYHGGWLVATGGGEDRVRWYDGTGTRKSDGPGFGAFAVSADGTRTAYAQSGALHIGITSGMGEGEQTVTCDAAATCQPVGFLRGDALVYQAGDHTVAVTAAGHPLPGMARARAVSAEADLVAGEDAAGNTVVLSGEGRRLWTSSEWAVWAISPDGRYAAATSSPSGGDTTEVAVLDARTGTVVARHDVLAAGLTVFTPVMDVDDSLLVAASDGRTMAQTVLRLDRDGTLSRATDVLSPDPSSDADHVVFAARP